MFNPKREVYENHQHDLTERLLFFFRFYSNKYIAFQTSCFAHKVRLQIHLHLIAPYKTIKIEIKRAYIKT